MDNHHNPELPPRPNPLDTEKDIWQLLSLPEKDVPETALLMQQFLVNAMAPVFLEFRSDAYSPDASTGSFRFARFEQVIFNRIEDYLSDLVQSASEHDSYRAEPLEILARCSYLSSAGETRYLAICSSLDSEGNSVVLSPLGDRIVKYKHFIATLVEAGESVADNYVISYAYSKSAFEEGIVDICLNWREHFSLASSYSIPLLEDIWRKATSPGQELHGIQAPEHVTCFEGGDGARFFRIHANEKTLLLSVDRNPIDCSPQVESFKYYPGLHLVSLAPLSVESKKGRSPVLARESLSTEEEKAIFHRAIQVLSKQHTHPTQHRSYQENRAIYQWLMKPRNGGEPQSEATDSIDRLDICSLRHTTRLGREYCTTLVMAKDFDDKHVLHTHRTHGTYDWGAVGIVLKSLNGVVNETYPVYSSSAFAEEIGRCLNITPVSAASLRQQSYLLDQVLSTISPNPYATNLVKNISVRFNTDHATFALQLAWEIKTVEIKRDSLTGLVSLEEKE